MGLFSNRPPGVPPGASKVDAFLLGHDLDDHELERIGLVGESHYQSAISAVCGRQGNEEVHFPCIAALAAERTNPYDPNAIQAQVDARHVGYLSRKDAILYHPIIDAGDRLGVVIACNAWIAARAPEGAETPNAGVFLHLPTPEVAAEELANFSREEFGQ
jgi:hypothetical protein